MTPEKEQNSYYKTYAMFYSEVLKTDLHISDLIATIEMQLYSLVTLFYAMFLAALWYHKFHYVWLTIVSCIIIYRLGMMGWITFLNNFIKKERKIDDSNSKN